MNKLKLIRLERGIKARDLARRAAIDPSYVTRIENGREPSRQVKARIANALGQPIKALWPQQYR